MKDQAIQRVIEVRSEMHEALTRQCGAMGTAVGRKKVAGVFKRQTALIVYVSRKTPLLDLGEEERIPKFVRFQGRRVPTDVCAVGHLRYQFGEPPWYCRDRIDNQATITGLCRDSAGTVYGITCAHALLGHDMDPVTSDVVHLWHPNLQEYVEVGCTGPCFLTSGYGQPENFGFSDWGLFSVSVASLVERAYQAPPMPFAPPMEGRTVTAETAHGVISGVVAHRTILIGRLRVDVAIALSQGATFPGDSGVVWRDVQGNAVAIHAIGMASPHGSQWSFSMAASRIASELGAAGFEVLDA